MKSTDVQSQEKLVNSIKAGEANSKNNEAAHRAAEADIQQDPELSDVAEKGDDLDEGELARLDGDK